MFGNILSKAQPLYGIAGPVSMPKMENKPDDPDFLTKIINTFSSNDKPGLLADLTGGGGQDTMSGGAGMDLLQGAPDDTAGGFWDRITSGDTSMLGAFGQAMANAGSGGADIMTGLTAGLGAGQQQGVLNKAEAKRQELIKALQTELGDDNPLAAIMAQLDPMAAATMGVDRRNAERGYEFQSGEAEKSRAFQGEQAGLDRDLTRSENAANRSFQGSQNAASRAHAFALENYKSAMKAAREANAPPDPELLRKLRKDYTSASGTFVDVRDAFDRVKSVRDSGVGDVALIFNYMKMLDPGSVVREGEFATAENTGGASDKLINTYNKLLNGARLTPRQRDEFKAQAGDLFKNIERNQRKLERQHKRFAETVGIRDTSLVTDSLGTGPSAAPRMRFDAQGNPIQ